MMLKNKGYYEMQLRTRTPSPYTTFRTPREVSEYEIGKWILGDADTYTRNTRILNTLRNSEKKKVNDHEECHIKNPSWPEWLVRDKTYTHLN